MSDTLKLLETLDKASLELSDEKLSTVTEAVEKFRNKHGRNPLRPIWWIGRIIPQVSEEDLKKIKVAV